MQHCDNSLAANYGSFAPIQRASVDNADANSRRSVFCFGPLDRRGKSKFAARGGPNLCGSIKARGAQGSSCFSRSDRAAATIFPRWHGPPRAPVTTPTIDSKPCGHVRFHCHFSKISITYARNNSKCTAPSTHWSAHWQKSGRSPPGSAEGGPCPRSRPSMMV